MKIILAFLLLIPNLMLSQRLEEVNGDLQCRVEYGIYGRDANTILKKSEEWLSLEFPIRETKFKDNKIIASVIHKKYHFDIEMISYKEQLIVKFRHFRKDGKVLKGKHIQKMNSFIYVLSGRMQNYIRNK